MDRLTPEIEQQLVTYAEQSGLLTVISDKIKQVESDTKNAADEAGRFAENLALGQEFLAASVRAGVASGAIPPQALGDLPQTDAEKAMERILEARRKAARALKETDDSGGRAIRTVRATANAVKTELTPAMKQLTAIGDMVGSSMENALMSMVDGTKSVKDAFKSMASEIIKELYRIFVVKQIVGLVSGFIGDPAMFGGMGGTSPVNGSVRPMARSFAGGGYTGNGSRSGGLDGKGGYMAMVHPRESIIDHTRGQSAGGVTVVQNINVSTGVQQTVRTEIKTLMPQIANAAKAAVADAKLRGGSYGRSFA